MSVDHPRNLTDAHTEQPKLSGPKPLSPAAQPELAVQSLCCWRLKARASSSAAARQTISTMRWPAFARWAKAMDLLSI